MSKTNKDSKNPSPSLASANTGGAAQSYREGVESIVIAIVLAFLFRAFEAEAFVIPTGSMAPTLQGRHKDVECPECGYQYQAGASVEAEMLQGRVEAVTCPMCFFQLEMDPRRSSHVSHTGDRILVNKFAYEAPFGAPERWDVIVFKYPGNAKQNYIKRLTGLPGETLRIDHGDIFVQPLDAAEVDGPKADFQIARKPPDKLKHMLQLVHDTKYLATTLQELDWWPLNWQPPADATSSPWSSPDRGETYLSEAAPETHWLHFRQYFMEFDDWHVLRQGNRNAGDPVEIPITDFYAYNAQTRPGPNGTFHHSDTTGMHWVGDLAIEAEAEVMSDAGTLSLLLIEAGRRHLCEIDIASGQVTLTINEGEVPFVDDAGNEVTKVTATTKIRGAGSYELRFANVDNQLLLWVDDDVVAFDHATTYPLTVTDRPVFSRLEPGDLHPVRIGSQQCAVKLERLRVLRDIYYIAVGPNSGPMPYDYSRGSEDQIRMHLLSPESWHRGDVLDSRKAVEFRLEDDQYFALGDNSPYSRDSRMWGNEYYVEGDLLIGKALLVYWPHAIRVPIPFTGKSIPLIPNIREFGLIH